MPPGDLESTWRNETLEEQGQSPLLGHRFIPTVAASTVKPISRVAFVVYLILCVILGSGVVVEGYKCASFLKNTTLHCRKNLAYR